MISGFAPARTTWRAAGFGGCRQSAAVRAVAPKPPGASGPLDNVDIRHPDDRTADVTDTLLPNLDRSTLRERALHALRGAITGGVYPPGEHLAEVELAGRLGVSRGTVREALRHLEQEGLVAGGARGMLRVAALTVREVHELYEVLAALESLAAAHLAASPARRAGIVALRACVDGLPGAADPVEAELAFHRTLAEAARNTVLLKSWRQLEGAVRVTVRAAGPDRALAPMPALRLGEIAEAIADGTPEAAGVLLRRYLRDAAHRLAPR